MEGLSKKEQKKKELMDTNNSVVFAGGRRVREVEEGTAGIKGDGQTLDLR